MRFGGIIVAISLLIVSLLCLAYLMNPGTDGPVDGVADLREAEEPPHRIEEILSGDFKRKPKKNQELGQGRLRGVVRDSGGLPVASATVQVTPVDKDLSVLVAKKPISHYWEEFTDEAGRFAFRTLPAGSFLISASTPGRHVVAMALVDDPGPFEELQLVVEGRIERRGTVVDGDGAPVAGALIVPLAAPDWPGDSTPFRYATVTSKESGDFIHPLLPTGSWDVLVSAKGYAPLRVRLVEGEKSEIKIGHGEKLQGRVLREDGARPLNNAPVVIAATDEAGESYSMRTNGQGYFSFGGLRPAMYSVSLDSDRLVAHAEVLVVDPASARKEPDSAAVRRVQIDPVTGVTRAPMASTSATDGEAIARDGAQLDVTLIARSAGSVRGRVLEAAADFGIPGVRIEAFLAGEERPVAAATSDQAGYYHLKGLDDGTYLLAAPGSSSQVIVVEEGATVKLADGQQVDGPVFRASEREELWGTVVDERGAAAGEANVFLRRQRYPGEARGRVTGSDGEFTLSGLDSEDEVLIWAEKMGMRSEDFGPVKVGKGGLQGIVLRLAPAPES